MLLADYPKSNWQLANDIWNDMTVEQLDRLSIRTGCETDYNRRADFELRKRGYVFNVNEQRWQLA